MFFCTCNRVAPLTLFLMHNPHVDSTVELHTVTLAYYLQGPAVSWCNVCTLTHTYEQNGEKIV